VTVKAPKNMLRVLMAVTALATMLDVGSHAADEVPSATSFSELTGCFAYADEGGKRLITVIHPASKYPPAKPGAL
jgi:hypothetical protein